MKKTAKYTASGILIGGGTIALNEIVKALASNETDSLILIRNQTEELANAVTFLGNKTSEGLFEIQDGLIEMASQAFNRTNAELDELKGEIATLLVDVVKQVVALQPEIQKQLTDLKNDLEILQNGGPPRTDFLTPFPQQNASASPTDIAAPLDQTELPPPKSPIVEVLPPDQIPPPKPARLTPIFPVYVFASIAASLLLCAVAYAVREIIMIVRMRPLDNNYDGIL